MKIKAYLTVNSRGTMRVTKTPPGVGYDEVVIALDMNLPDALFSKPRLVAKIEVPTEAVNAREIKAEVVDNISNAIKSAAGLPVEITLITPDDHDA